MTAQGAVGWEPVTRTGLRRGAIHAEGGRGQYCRGWVRDRGPHSHVRTDVRAGGARLPRLVVRVSTFSAIEVSLAADNPSPPISFFFAAMMLTCGTGFPPQSKVAARRRPRGSPQVRAPDSLSPSYDMILRNARWRSREGHVWSGRLDVWPECILAPLEPHAGVTRQPTRLLNHCAGGGTTQDLENAWVLVESQFDVLQWGTPMGPRIITLT